MTTLTRANTNWANRANQHNFLSVTEMLAFYSGVRETSKEARLNVAELKAIPDSTDPKGLSMVSTAVGSKGNPFGMSNWAFKQLMKKATVPQEYMSRLPAKLAADNINYGLSLLDKGSDDYKMNVILRKDGDGAEAQAFLSPTYGRVGNEQIVKAIHSRFGDGLTGDFTIPGEFKKKVPITVDTTTLHGNDRNMFVFLADEEHRIEVPNRRNGKPGSLARGFFVWNSDVGDCTLGVAFFYFDYMCSNHLVWGAEGYKEITLRHSKGAPDRWLHELTPQLAEFSNGKASTVEQHIKRAQDFKIKEPLEFLTGKAGLPKSLARDVMLTHLREENTDKPIETLWEASSAVTAHAKAIPFADDRVVLERVGGKILDLVAA